MESRSRECKKYSIEKLLKSETLIGHSFSYDDKQLLFTSDRTGIFNVYSISTNGGEPKALTTSTSDTIQSLGYFPEDNRFLFMKDDGGNELLHIFVGESDGNIKELTPGEKMRAEFYGWSHDGKSFYYGANGRDPRYMDLFAFDTTSYETTCIYENSEGYHFHAISDDESVIAFSKENNANDTDMYVYFRDTREMKHVSPHEGDAKFYPQTFNHTNSKLLFLTDVDGEFLKLRELDLETGAVQLVLEEDWDITSASYSHGYRYLVYSVNEDATYTFKVLDQTTGNVVTIDGLPDGTGITSLKVSRSEKFISLYTNPSNETPNLYVYDIEGETLKKLTNTLNPEVNQEDLVVAEIVRYPSFDGLMIPAVLFKPHLKEGEKAPGLVWVHGGPGGQSFTHYNVIIQYLVNNGYAVLAVNNRGSSGYGKSFFKAADHQHGEVDLADCVEGKNYLKTLDYINPDRIGIIGGSYGGYMVGAALAFRPDEFNVGVNIFGVMNWERTLKSIPAWWESGRASLYKKIGDPYEETEYIRSISPLFHAHKITKPLIVLQGANDPRVLKVESDEIVEAVKKNDVPVEYIVFEDEGHGFTKKENQIKGYQAILKFLEKYL